MFSPMSNKPLRLFASVMINVIASAIVGIAFAAMFQRLNGMFFYNVFIGTILSGAASFLFFKLATKKAYAENFVRPYAVIISALLCFSFLSTIPLTIDRSYSVWLLKYAAEAEFQKKTINKEVLIRESTDFFRPSNGQLDRRIDEQIRIGNFKIGKDDVIKLSNKGLLSAKLNNLIGIIFGLEPKYSRLKMR
jgi:hypothetical protein